MCPGRHPEKQTKSTKILKVCVGTCPAAISGWDERKNCRLSVVKRLRCAFCAINTMLFTHYTESVWAPCLIPSVPFRTSLGMLLGSAAARSLPESLSKNYSKTRSTLCPEMLQKRLPAACSRTLFLILFSLSHPSWESCRPQSRHKGAETTKMLPKLSWNLDCHKLSF